MVILITFLGLETVSDIPCFIGWLKFAISVSDCYLVHFWEKEDVWSLLNTYHS